MSAQVDGWPLPGTGYNVRTGRRDGPRVTQRSIWVSGGIGSCGSFFLNACFLSTLGSKAINREGMREREKLLEV